MIMIFMASCGRIEGPDKTFRKELINATPDFRQGWEDGCQVGKEAGGNTFYKMFSKANKIDGYKIANSADYKTAWNYSFWYCYREEYIDMKSSIYGSIFSGYQ